METNASNVSNASNSASSAVTVANLSDASKIREEWAIKEKRQFCKQSCTKISQGLEKLDNRSSERAIWELFQNARDLARRDEAGRKIAHIRMKVTPEEFIFAHQGRPFTHDSFSSLVKQVSAQEKEDEESVGQYGTGFLTTHSFGRRIRIYGSLDMEDLVKGQFVDIDGFVIDRVFDEIPDFVDKMAAQLVEIDKYADGPFTTSCREWTELHYQLDSADKAAEKVTRGLEEAIKVMPYVMTINEPIGDVEIEDQTTGRHIKFRKEALPEENGLKVMAIFIEENFEVALKKIFYLQSEDGSDTVILPLESVGQASPLDGIAKLFVFFPLLGTESFGMDAIFHSNRFTPVEERDALHLPVENANVKAKYEKNVSVLEEMSRIVFDYYEKHALEITGWQDVTSLSFECFRNKEDITNTFFSNFKAKWVHAYEQLPMVDINGVRQTVKSGNVRVYSQALCTELAGEKEAWRPVVYRGAKYVGNVPSEEHIMKWSETIGTWYEDSLSFISDETIAARLADAECDRVVLLNFCSYLSEQKLTHLFERYALLPNHDGQKQVSANLVDAEAIPDWLRQLVKQFIPNSVAKFVARDFSKLVSLNVYGRDSLKKDLNDALLSIAKESFRKPVNPQTADMEVLKGMAQISMIVRNDEMDNHRTRAMKAICDHLGMAYAPVVLPALDSEERDLTELPFQHLVENLCLEISSGDSTWMVANREYVYRLHEALNKWVFYYGNDRTDGVANRYAILPNQLNEPRLLADLKFGKDIPSKLMDLYEAVLDTDLRGRLVANDFSDFISIPTLEAAEVAKEIEDKLEEDNFQHSSVLDIIDLIDSDLMYARLFPHVSEKKADIFMKQVKPECKDSVYRLMKIDDSEKLKQLAELADETDLDEIIRMGRQAKETQRLQRAEFEYKAKLGEYVEEILTETLEQRLAHMIEGGLKETLPEIKVLNEQYGKDLTVTVNGESVYFIEIKSRWGVDQSVEMSPLQMRTSVENRDAYALCCVNMSGVDHNVVEKRIFPEIEESLDRIKSLTNIGHLVTEVNKVTLIPADDIHLGGSYSCVVPQKVFQAEGVSFDILMDTIKEKCMQAIFSEELATSAC